MNPHHFPPGHHGPTGRPGPHQGPGAQSFPVVTAMLGGYDFHAYAPQPTPADLLRGRSAGVATSPAELINAAQHQPSDLPLKIRTAGNKAKWAGISLGASFFLFLGGGFYLNDGPVLRDLIGGIIVMASILAVLIAIYFGVRAINQLVKGPELQVAASRRAIEEATGTSLDDVPVIYVGARQLPAEDRVLLQQLCGFYNLLQERGYPMGVSQWKSLTKSALDSVGQFHFNGDLGTARSVGATIMEWTKASEEAVRTRTEFTTRGMMPPQF